MLKVLVFLLSFLVQTKLFAKECKVSFIDFKKNIDKKIDIEKQAKFQHPKNKFENYLVTVTKHSMSLEVKNSLDDSGKDFIKYEIKCQSNLSCSGGRDYFSKTHQRIQDFSIQGQTYASIAKIGNREIFHFEVRKGRLNLFFLKYKLKGKQIGTLVSCKVEK